MAWVSVVAHVVLIRPPSMTKFAPVTLAVRPDASRTMSVATSSGVVKRPVGDPPMAATILSRAVSPPQ